MSAHPNRRTVLAVGTAATAAYLLPTGTATAADRIAPTSGLRPTKIPLSQNGWQIQNQANHVSTVWTRSVSGTGLRVDVRIGLPELLLLHIARRFHYEVQELRAGDVQGWSRIGRTPLTSPASNLSSGTALRLVPGARSRGSYFPQQVRTIRDIVSGCAGAVRWGGDDDPVDESLYYLTAGPDSGELMRVAPKFQEWSERLGAATR
ncbi:hypothetical protein [Streptomyces sp. NL15-2K]|uniref:hypothetical protein n=1 Tax=Streptomyces sp. NL15-2K TaxID=376149 RepID=UPI000F56D38D|nr:MULTISPECIES: hypothetical protein [Actinomycetes]WKX11889.1 hypothetical protein Q4V64_32015 [Kutzneria buriramensis]GCB46623.1 hypothetical protein SNL152K_3921 [Streptomyces sp. NL15-2K]